MTAVRTLDEDELYETLRDPCFGAGRSLNEIMTRHPDAISFAPGAPHLTFLDDLDLARCIAAYRDHLCRRRGLSPQAAHRLLCEYGPSRGLINDLVADALQRELGVPVGPDGVVVTVGAQEALLLTLRALCRQGDVLAVVEPCYVGVIGAARLLGIGVVPVPEGERGADLDVLADRCRAARRAGQRVRALYTAPDFANPSGTRMELAHRRALLDVADREDLLLIEDGTYGFTAAPGEELPALKTLDTAGRVVHVGTYAKVCLPGARVGFVLADQPVRGRDGTVRLLADDLAALKGMVTVNTPPVCQAVIGGLLVEHGGSLAGLARERSAFYRRNLSLLLDLLDRRLLPGEPGGVPAAVRWNRPEGGFFVRMRLPVPADTALLHTAASDHGVLWTPMSAFHVGEGGEYEIRLSCSYLDAGEIDEGVLRLARFLRALPT